MGSPENLGNLQRLTLERMQRTNFPFGAGRTLIFAGRPERWIDQLTVILFVPLA